MIDNGQKMNVTCERGYELKPPHVEIDAVNVEIEVGLMLK
jgi:hypothetical protein